MTGNARVSGAYRVTLHDTVNVCNEEVKRFRRTGDVRI
jgi:hypothetical protein